MTWIRLDCDIASHRKTLCLRNVCGTSTPQIVGHLAMLFAKLAENESDGSLVGLPAAVIEEWAGWTGEPGVFDAAFRANFVTNDVIDGWDERQGILIERMRKDRERHAAKRRQNVRGTSAELPQTESGTSAENPDATYTLTGTTTSSSTREASSIRSELPNDCREAYDELLSRARSPAALEAELLAMHSGLHPPAYAWNEIGRAVRDLVANGKHERPNARQLRRYVEAVREEDERAKAPKPANGNGYHGPPREDPDAARAFDEAMSLIRSTPGGSRYVVLDGLPPPMRAGIRAADGVRALADADEIGLRIKRKAFLAAYTAACLQPVT